jgi:type IV secretory pathway TrbF-like protein
LPLPLLLLERHCQCRQQRQQQERGQERGQEREQHRQRRALGLVCRLKLQQESLLMNPVACSTLTP